MRKPTTLLTLLFLVLCVNVIGQSINYDIRILTNRMLEINITDGELKYPQRLSVLAIDLNAASDISNFELFSKNDENYKSGRNPIGIYRKSKGVKFNLMNNILL